MGFNRKTGSCYDQEDKWNVLIKVFSIKYTKIRFNAYYMNSDPLNA